ncbi:MAG: PQQ-binding-like beta-propeller repeat protein [Planctomycetes bacterium]|nr:PQQ-binding-like beta-propeller repeat protein [Planctomycetota bacterium]
MSKPFSRIVSLFLFLSSYLVGGASAQTPTGWRTDGTGRYPAATPPDEWSREKNVVWKTKMPGRSYGSPIVIGKRIYVVSDPAEMLCVQESDGKVLWQRSITVSDVFGPEKAQQIVEAWKKINDQKRKLQREYRDLRKNQPNAKELLQKMRDRVRAIDLRIKEMRRSNPVPGRGGSGNSASTPVSDGKFLYAAFGNGIVAAFDAKGGRRWTRFVEGTQIGFGHASSLALVDGKLIVHYHDLIALDAASGKEVWRAKAGPRHASPIVAHIGGTPILILPAGSIVRVRDGKILATHNDLRVSECSLIISNGIVYAQSGKTSAFRLPAKADETTTLAPLWQVRTARGRRTPSPVLHNGLLYGVTTNGILDVLDAKTGKGIYRERLNIGNVYSSPTVAGNRLFVSSTRGVTLVLKLGRKFKPIAKNELESIGSCPVFVGHRMYVRCHSHLYCIGK